MSLSIPTFPPGPYYSILWPGFCLCSGECLLPANKQENRPCHDSLGLPHSSLIRENMYSGQRFLGLPSRPCQSSVFLSANMQTNTCTKGHILPRKYCILIGEHRYKHIHYETLRYSRGLYEHVCAFMCTLTFSPTLYT